MQRAILLLLATMLCACVDSTKKDTVTMLMDKWVGRSVDDLVAASGPPSDVFMLDSGGRVFEYFKNKMVANDSEPGKRYIKNHYDEYGNLVHADTSGVRSRALRPKDNICKIQFNVAASNIIQSWSQEGDGCN